MSAKFISGSKVCYNFGMVGLVTGLITKSWPSSDPLFSQPPLQPQTYLNLRLLSHKEFICGASLQIIRAASREPPHRLPWVCVVFSVERAGE